MKIDVNKMRRALANAGRSLAGPASSSSAASLLEVWLPTAWPETPGHIHWRWRTAQGALQSGTVDTLEAIPAPARAARTRVWTSPMDTSLLRVTLPTRSRAKIIQALPYALEEQLLDDPENLHFAFQDTGQGDLAVAVTRRERLNAWLAALNGAGIRPISLAPALFALPTVEQAWTVHVRERDVVWRSATFAGGGGWREERCPALLTRALRETQGGDQSPGRLLLVDAPVELDAESWGKGLTIPVERMEGSVQAAQATAPAINLLQGELSPSGVWFEFEMFKPYLPAAALLVLWLVGGWIGGIVEWAGLQREHLSHQSDMKKILLDSFPETRTVLDPPQQMQRALEQLQAQRGAAAASDFLPLLSHVAPALQRDNRLRLQSLSYADKGIVLSLSAPDEPALETIKKSLTTGRLDVEVQNVNRHGSTVEARIRVRSAVSTPTAAKGAS
jgi:general secretion pathway protein L